MSFGFATAVITAGTRGSKPRQAGARAPRKPSAGRMARYIAREGDEYSTRRNNLPDEIVGTGAENLPNWASGSATRFFEAADRFERANGRRADLRIVTLPRDLPPEEQVRVAREVGHHLYGDRHPYSWTVHNSVAADGGAQPHIHYESSTRILDEIDRAGPEHWFRQYNARHPERGGAKKAWVSGVSRADRAAALMTERVAVASIINTALERVGSDRRVDARSNADRGLPPPEKKLPISERKNPAAKALLQSERDLKKASATATAAMTSYANSRSRSARRPQPDLEPHPKDLTPRNRMRRAEAVRTAKARRTEELGPTAPSPRDLAIAALRKERVTPAKSRHEAEVAAGLAAHTRTQQQLEENKRRRIAARIAVQEQHRAKLAAEALARKQETEERTRQARQPQPANAVAEPPDLQAISQQRRTQATELAQGRRRRHLALEALRKTGPAAPADPSPLGASPLAPPVGAKSTGPIVDQSAPAATATSNPTTSLGQPGSKIGILKAERLLRESGLLGVGKDGTAGVMLAGRGDELAGRGKRPDEDKIGLFGLIPDLVAMGMSTKDAPTNNHWQRITLLATELASGLAKMAEAKAREIIERLQKAAVKSLANLATQEKEERSRQSMRRGRGPGF